MAAVFTGRSESPPGICLNVGTESHTHGTTSSLVGHPSSKASQVQGGPPEPRSERTGSGGTSLAQEEWTLGPSGRLVLNFAAITSQAEQRWEKNWYHFLLRAGEEPPPPPGPGSSPATEDMTFCFCLFHAQTMGHLASAETLARVQLPLCFLPTPANSSPPPSTWLKFGSSSLLRVWGGVGERHLCVPQGCTG